MDLRFVVDDDLVSVTHNSSTQTFRADGGEHQTDRPGFVLAARWQGRHVLEVFTKKNGEVEGQGKYKVSADGKTLTITQADATQIILDRVAS